MKRIIVRFFRSPVGVAVLGSGAAAAAVLVLVGGVPAPVAVPLCLLAVAAAAFVLLSSPVGARAVAGEGDRDRRERDARALGGVAAARKRLSLLRVGDPEVKAAIDRLTLAAGLYLERAVKTDGRDPVSEDAVLGAVEVLNDYLQLADAASSRVRSGGAADLDIAVRTVGALSASAAEIERRLDPQAAADRIAAREELR